MVIGEKKFPLEKKTYIVGILNVTPDSFSDGGRYIKIDKALKQVEKMIQEGVDIVDCGGESTRPGYEKLSAEDEIRRVVPVIEKIKREFNIPVSLDTYKAEVAQSGISYGADMINDIWGLTYDDKMADVISKNKVACCIMHNRNPKPTEKEGETGKHVFYEDFLNDVKNDINNSVQIAKRAGISKDRIMIDPGIGFAKSYEQNLLLIQKIATFKEMGYPVLLGASRKSVIGLTLDVNAASRLEGTLAITAYAVLNGCSFVRVHDVLENKRVIQMLEAIQNCK